MIQRQELLTYCDELMDITQFKDYCPNGLQVQGTEQVKKIVAGVTASQELIDKTIASQADMLLVHHGFFWKGESLPLVGMKYQRIRSLLLNNINLVAYHLPLDAHVELGNNIQLARQLDIEPIEFCAENKLLLMGAVDDTSGADLFQRIARGLGREPLHVEVDKKISKVAICTGAAQGYIEMAFEQGADAFISGEVSENTWHFARENQIHYFAAGHHATERYGVKALGQHLAEKFNLDYQFLDLYNPV